MSSFSLGARTAFGSLAGIWMSTGALFLIGVGQVADLGGIVARVDRILHEKAKRSDVSSLDPRLLLG